MRVLSMNVFASVLLLAAVLTQARDWKPHYAWGQHGRLAADVPVSLTVALKQQNIDHLEAVVRRVSDPIGAEYGKYLSVDQLRELVAPSQEVFESVSTYFTDIGATEVTGVLTGDFLQVTIPAGKLEAALGVRMHAFTHHASRRALYRTLDQPRLPAEIAEHVELITGLTDFFDYPSERKQLAKMHTSSANASSAPEISNLRGGSSSFNGRISLYCKDGSAATDAAHPCSNHPPVVSSVLFTVTPRAHDSILLKVPYSELACATVNASFSGMQVQCLMPEFHIPKYRRSTVQATVIYSDGTDSAVGNYPTEFAPTPYILPRVIYERYGVPLDYRSTNASNSQSVVGFEKQYISVDQDLRAFFHEVGMPFDEPLIHGENDPTMPGGESTLDIQYVMGVGAGVPTTFWSVSGPVGSGGYILTWAMQIANTTDAPLVTSISYGDTEKAYFNKFGSWDYINRMNAELAKMAARGLTVIAGSGDAGCSNVGEMGNDLSSADPTCSPFRPFFPSNSPYVLSVSATFLSPNSLPICQDTIAAGVGVECDQLGEIAVSVRDGLFWTTGGGFSNLKPIQPFQSEAVNAYLNNPEVQLPPSSYWNRTGRGYPDVSTLGHNLLVNWNGKIVSIGGTSASGPVLAGLVALLNNERLNTGKPSMGFMNPWLYNIQKTRPESFRDVTVGSNFDGDIQPRGSPYPSTCDAGFTTATGWDPVTGLGTPNWSVWRDLALSA